MRKALEDLIFLGVMTETVDVYGIKCKLQSLTSEEHLEATNSTGLYESLSRVYALKLEILARALKEVNGIVLSDYEETIKFVNKLQPPIINKLYDEYEKMQQKQLDTLNNVDELKN